MNREGCAGHEHLGLCRRGKGEPDEETRTPFGAEIAGWRDALAGANVGRTVQSARAEGWTIACKSAEGDSKLASRVPSDRDVGRGDARGRRSRNRSSVEYLGFSDSLSGGGSRLPSSSVRGPARRLHLEGSHRHKSICNVKARVARGPA